MFIFLQNFKQRKFPELQQKSEQKEQHPLRSRRKPLWPWRLNLVCNLHHGNPKDFSAHCENLGALSG